VFGFYVARHTFTWSVDDIISAACLVYDYISRLSVCVSQCLLLMVSARSLGSLSQEESFNSQAAKRDCLNASCIWISFKKLIRTEYGNLYVTIAMRPSRQISRREYASKLSMDFSRLQRSEVIC